MDSAQQAIMGTADHDYDQLVEPYTCKSQWRQEREGAITKDR